MSLTCFSFFFMYVIRKFMLYVQEVLYYFYLVLVSNSMPWKFQTRLLVRSVLGKEDFPYCFIIRPQVNLEFLNIVELVAK